MIETIGFCQFVDRFREMGRKDNFSYDALEALFQYLEDTDPDYELDVIGLCCKYSESSIEEVRKNYSLSTDDYSEDEDVIEYLKDNTTVISENPLVYRQF